MGFGVESLNKGSLANFQIAIRRFDGENSTADFFARGGCTGDNRHNTILNISDEDRQKLQELFRAILQGKKDNKPLSKSDILAALEEILIKISLPDNTMPKIAKKKDLVDLFKPRSSSSYPDFVPIDSPLGKTLSRPQMDYRPVDGMYRPVYGEDMMGQRRIIGYKKISEQEKRWLLYQA